MFTAEYVNIFGIPFTFLPHESDEDVVPRPEREKTEIKPVPEKVAHEIKIPQHLPGRTCPQGPSSRWTRTRQGRW